MAEAAHSFDDSAAYERFMGRWSRAVGTEFLAWLAPPASTNWLDVGCGTGIFTELIVDTCHPADVVAVDPSASQIEHARRQPKLRQATFRVADAQALPFPAAAFDVVVSALVINFVPDRPRALTEMRRVTRAQGLVAGYVWDFSAELSPSWPLRAGMRRVGVDVPDVPGTAESTPEALDLLFRRAGFEAIAAKSFDVTVPHLNFDDFWQAQTPSYSPTTKIIGAMSSSDRERLMDAVRATLPIGPDGRIEYSARANAIRGYLPAQAPQPD
jgi:ubiquinone/menaquinone biosynthesis C-methylase UbiE